VASVDFENVNRVYGNGANAIHDLNLSIVDAELIVMVGPSGCGKSTALRMAPGWRRSRAVR